MGTIVRVHGSTQLINSGVSQYYDNNNSNSSSNSNNSNSSSGNNSRNSNSNNSTYTTLKINIRPVRY